MIPASDVTVLRRPPGQREYAGMSAMTADERARELIAAAAASGVWTHLPEHLAQLRAVAVAAGGRA
ncbi:hypothetical protein [Azospirillum argentinense]|uniref:hypothetical protein n=1 Tax=Azospirillum argentinense TaxID=2970906 RepID=UPI0032DF9C7F